MSALDWLCRRYQSLFRHGHPEEARLVELHSTGQTDLFLREYFDHEYRKGADVVARFAALARGWVGGRALDFGCGAGGLTYQIARSCPETVGIDLEEYKLRFAREQRDRLGAASPRFVCYDGAKLPFADESFDCLFCVDVIEHLPTPDYFVSEFRRVLAPGGLLLLSFGPPWYHAHGKHMWAKVPGWWTHLLFPRRVVMRAGGIPPDTTYEQIGLHRLSVSKFRRIMDQSGFTCLYLDERIHRLARPMKLLPGLRELFIGEVVGVYRK
jgi:ubiquinone/menaquinone biosynthesis C-methylase UbiE